MSKELKDELAALHRKIDRISSMIQNLPVTHNTDLGEWLSEEQAKELLKKGTTSLWKLRCEGIIKYSKLGGRNYYSKTSIENYLERNSKTSL